MNLVNLQSRRCDIGRTQGYARTVQGTLCELKDLAPKPPKGGFKPHCEISSLLITIKIISKNYLNK